jgi:hypothetical protein
VREIFGLRVKSPMIRSSVKSLPGLQLVQLVVLGLAGGLGQSLGGLGQRLVTGGSAIWLFLFKGARQPKGSELTENFLKA